MAKDRKKDNTEELCSDETPEISFQDKVEPTGKEVASFSFDDNNTPEEATPIIKPVSKQTAAPKSSPTFKRSYMLTEETIRKVDELKAIHPDLTTYVSTIVELSIIHYYDYIMAMKHSN